MSDSTRIEKLREEIEKLCGNCDRPDKEELGEIVLSSMTFGFSEGLKAPSVDRPQGEWVDKGKNLWKCSNCEMIIYSESEQDRNEFHKWCSRCGARMKGADDEYGV